METFFPIFESGQVLTSANLNHILAWMNEQDRGTRRKAIGIGILCGLEVAMDAYTEGVLVGKGCAITSEGHLLCQGEDKLFTQYRSYHLPVASDLDGLEQVLSETPAASYPPFIESNGSVHQIELWELFTEEEEPLPDTPSFHKVTANFLRDKIVLLFLECDLESLKSCDVNNCSDKGGRANYTIKTLLMPIKTAQKIAKDTGVRPVDQHKQIQDSLKPLTLEKLNLCANHIASLDGLNKRVIEIAIHHAKEIEAALQHAYQGFFYLLKDLYAANPFSSSSGIFNLGSVSNNASTLLQFYTYLYDLVQAHNEFVDAACRLEAECCPDPRLFPKHVFLGNPLLRIEPTQRDPLLHNFQVVEAAAQVTPLPYRHDFRYSPIFDRQNDLYHKVRSLHFRVALMTTRFNAVAPGKQDIRITPSRIGNVTLSEKAIPYYYRIERGGLLHRNWSYDLAAKNRLDDVHSYYFMNPADHPLENRMEGHNFFRVEGIHGRGLSEVLDELHKQRCYLGLNFNIATVLVPSRDLSAKEKKLHLKSFMGQPLKPFMGLHYCRFKDMDSSFLPLLGTLFQFLTQMQVMIAKKKPRYFVAIASKANIVLSAAMAETVTETPGGTPVTNFISSTGTPADILKTFRMDPQTYTQSEEISDEMFGSEVWTYAKGDVLRKWDTGQKAEETVGNFYLILQDEGTGGSLYDETYKKVVQFNWGPDAQKVTEALMPTLAVMDLLEEIFALLRVRSIVEFDFKRFNVLYENLSLALSRYLAQNLGNASADSPAAIQQHIARSYAVFASSGLHVAIMNYGKLYRSRVEELLKEQTLEKFSKKHPGLQHHGGVPEGGTLVLLCSYEDYLKASTGANAITDKQIKMFSRELAKSELMEFWQTRYAGNIGGEEARLAAEKSYDRLMEAKQFEDLMIYVPSMDPLNYITVMGDFFLPGMCCDTICDWRAFTGKVAVVETDGKIGGGVHTVANGNKIPLNHAIITAHSVKTNERYNVEMKDGAFAMSAPPGDYRLVIAAPEYETLTRTVTLKAGQPMELDIELKAETPPAPASPTEPTQPTQPERPTRRTPKIPATKKAKKIPAAKKTASKARTKARLKTKKSSSRNRNN